jgi:cell division transport system permease protein
VIRFLENLSQTEKVTPLSDAQMQRLMSPWLGKNVDLKTLPLPKLIDVRLKAGTSLDFEQVQKDLSEVDPLSSIDNHRMWLSKLMKFADALRLLAVTVLILVLICSAFSIFYATQTSLGIHSRIIEILHIIGATDDYIARQYARRSFRMGFVAGLFGLVAALGVVYGIGVLARGIDAGILSVPSLGIVHLVCMATIPLWTAFLAMLTAYKTVKSVLGKIM